MDEKLNSRTVFVAFRPPPILILSHGVFTTPKLERLTGGDPGGLPSGSGYPDRGLTLSAPLIAEQVGAPECDDDQRARREAQHR